MILCFPPGSVLLPSPSHAPLEKQAVRTNTSPGYSSPWHPRRWLPKSSLSPGLPVLRPVAGSRRAQEGSRAPWSSTPAVGSLPGTVALGIAPSLPRARQPRVTPGRVEVWERAEGWLLRDRLCNCCWCLHKFGEKTPLSFEMTTQRGGTGVNFEMMNESPNTFPKLAGVAGEQRKLGCVSPQLPATDLLCVSSGFHTHIWSRLPNQPAAFQTYVWRAPWFVLLCGQQGGGVGKLLCLASASPHHHPQQPNNSCRCRGYASVVVLIHLKRGEG